ncbi:cytochrome b561 and DOMON domain-containing protein At5g47530-like [Carica papaya]|uniref:cytochrome b561 and DOMON domain-containing protein At5g47530-like n=1 Tax=Carica papaya TaxID=3649 RepID=UPI000B8C8E5E|nr:cytochrome b561 and DOMON domain-containing protein At5g47530-like [Carica papaya]
MAITSRLIVIIFMLTASFLVSSAENCSTYKFPGNQVFNSCIDLPVLQAHLHWNYIPLTKSIQIAYRASQSITGWIAWGINPTGLGMVGTQALVAFRSSNGSMEAHTTPITSYMPLMQPRNLSFPVSNISAEYANQEMIIFAMLGPLRNRTAFNHTWQAGHSVSSNNIPQIHSTEGPNVESVGTVNFHL